MAEAVVTITHEVGLHARPAATFVKTAKGFESTITLTNLSRDGASADAKSLVQIFKAAVAKDHVVRITAEGADEDEAVAALVGLIESTVVMPSVVKGVAVSPGVAVGPTDWRPRSAVEQQMAAQGELGDGRRPGHDVGVARRTLRRFVSSSAEGRSNNSTSAGVT
ncbi:MAG: HPr family phosphocarrier protein [Acidimicrobiales bacterium]